MKFMPASSDEIRSVPVLGDVTDEVVGRYLIPRASPEDLLE
jgi:hypothetical protein